MSDFKETWNQSKSEYRFDSIDVSLLENMRGYNHNGRTSFVSKNKDIQGMVFFTRPQLNLSTANVQFDRRLYGLLDKSEMSTGKYIRMMLDPRLGVGYKTATGAGFEAIRNPYINNKLAFIPILSNTLTSLTGWPDILVPTKTSEPGLYKEVLSYVDGQTHIRNQVPLTASFRRTAGSIVLNMFWVWSLYMAQVFEGKLTPYPDFIYEDEFDYQTRVFRLIFDSTGRYVTNIAATGPGTVESVGIGSIFNFRSDEASAVREETNDFSFKFHGVEYNDPVLIYEFNQTVNIFNPAMREPGNSDSGLVKIPHPYKYLFQYEGYPRINYNDGEFELWVEREVATQILKHRVPAETRTQIANSVL